jgi:hypothetical protein
LLQVIAIDWLVLAAATGAAPEAAAALAGLGGEAAAAGTALTAPHLQRTFLPALSSATRRRIWQDGQVYSIDIVHPGGRAAGKEKAGEQNGRGTATA